MPCQKGDEGSKKYNHEKWQAGNPGDMSHMWHQDVQDWEELGFLRRNPAEIKKDWMLMVLRYPVLFFFITHSKCMFRQYLTSC